ncbi:MAG: rhomboid family intramembrane serine protease [Marinobacter sp.]|uniref:rhomboid family intramembrane serine protease n=1 Tax=Marinobacter sp. TaxID=50741 RepID=UPI0034A095B4
MYRVKQIESSIDLAGFSLWLNQHHIVHRITEEGGQQVLWLEDSGEAEPVLAALDQFISQPELRAEVNAASHSPVHVAGRWQPSPKHAPLVLSAIILAAIMAWVTGLGQSELTAWLMFVDPRAYGWASFDLRMTAFMETMASGQFWRLVSPDFLHFSWPHVIFNSVMLWFLGSQIEWFDGKGRLIALFLVTSLASNGLQYMISGPLFGGLSGVVYGVLGYCWLSQQRVHRFQFPPALVIFAVVWMLIGFTPLPEWLGMGRMANEAHLGGFLAGLLMAVAMPLSKKTPPEGGV